MNKMPSYLLAAIIANPTDQDCLQMYAEYLRNDGHEHQAEALLQSDWLWEDHRIIVLRNGAAITKPPNYRIHRQTEHTPENFRDLRDVAKAREYGIPAPDIAPVYRPHWDAPLFAGSAEEVQRIIANAARTLRWRYDTWQVIDSCKNRNLVPVAISGWRVAIEPGSIPEYWWGNGKRSHYRVCSDQYRFFHDGELTGSQPEPLFHVNLPLDAPESLHQWADALEGEASQRIKERLAQDRRKEEQRLREKFAAFDKENPS